MAPQGKVKSTAQVPRIEVDEEEPENMGTGGEVKEEEEEDGARRSVVGLALKEEAKDEEDEDGSSWSEEHASQEINYIDERSMIGSVHNEWLH